MKRNRVTVFYGGRSAYPSYVLAGLFELREEGFVDLSFDRPPTRHRLPDDTIANLWLRVTDDSGREKYVHWDMNDAPDYWDAHALDTADCYVKRSFSSEAMTQLTPPQRARVMPMGLHYPCESRHASWADRVRRAWLTTPPSTRLRAARRRAAALIPPRPPLLASHAAPFIDELEHPPHQPSEATVYLRTRLYDLDAAPDPRAKQHRQYINETRVATIRALAAALGSRFQGGLDESPASRKYHPELIYSLPPGLRGKRGHLEVSRRHLVNVTTAGVSESTGWRVPEALAASRCVVANPLAFENLQKPVPGEHLLTFTTPEECVAACETLLADPERATAMRHAAWAYYQQHVHPARAVHAVLEQTLSETDRATRKANPMNGAA